MVYLYETEASILRSIVQKMINLALKVRSIPIIGKWIYPDLETEEYFLNFLSSPVPIKIEDEKTAKYLYQYLIQTARKTFKVQKEIPMVSDHPYNIVNNLAIKIEKAFPSVLDE